MMSTFTVLNTHDSGIGSLRQAITSANNNGGADTIEFNIPGAGLHTITPLTDLPHITERVFINGFSQPGSSPNTADMDEPINAVYRIQLDGHLIGEDGTGIYIQTGDLSEVRGLVINRFGYGVIVRDGFGNLIAGNFLGTNVAGTMAPTPAQGSGVFSYFDAEFTVIGGPEAADRNLISGNGLGIAGGATASITQGNFIGTDFSGSTAIPNTNGISLNSVANAIVGGTTFAEGNLISGNTENGLIISNFYSQDITVQGNRFGTNRMGRAATGLTNGTGILIQGSYSGGPHDNLIGGLGEGEANVITNSIGAGIAIVPSSGATYNGQVQYPIRNEISGNSIYGNGGLGIDINNDGVTANDFSDGDGGSNHRQNAPVITLATIGNHHMEGSLNSTPYTNFRIEVFSSFSQHSGKTFLGSVDVFTNGDGDATFELESLYTPAAGQFITATATNTNTGYGSESTGDTSEFSEGFAFPAPDEEPFVLPNDINVEVVDGKLKIVGGSNGNNLDILIVPPKKGETLSQFVISGLGSTTVNGQRSVTFSASGIASISMGNFNDSISITSKGKRSTLDGTIIDTKMGEDVLVLKNIALNAGKVRMGLGRDTVFLKKTTISNDTLFDLRRTEWDSIFAANSKVNLGTVYVPE